MPTRGLSVAAVAILATAPSASQTFSVSPFVQGQPFLVSAASGVAPSGDCAFLVGLGGVGPGPCVRPTLCLDLLDPWAVFSIVQLDGLGGGLVYGILPSTMPLIEIDLQAVIVTAPGGVLSLEKTAAVARFVQPISVFSDSFDGPAVDASWRWHESAEMLPPVVQSGALYLQPTATGAAATWFQNEEGPGLFKSVTGDFTVTTVLHVSNPAAASPIPVPPPISYRLAGLLARDPASAPGSRNSVHVALGAGDAATPLAVEDKTTQNSASVFQLHATPSHHAELRLQRVGATFTMSWRPIGAVAWNVVATHVRPDLPPTLEVGPMAYSNSAPALILAQFDDVAFGP